MDSAGNLIPSSPLVSDINCMKPGGGTDYADAMTAAYNELNLHNRPGVQKIIVLLSDGAANFGQNCVTKTINGKQSKTPTPLHPTLPISRQRRRHLQTTRHPDLHHPLRRPNHRPRLPDYTGANEVPFQQPWTAMQAIASPGNYYPDPNPTNLVAIFQQSPQTWPPAPAASSTNHPRHGNAAVQAPRDPSRIASSIPPFGGSSVRIAGFVAVVVLVWHGGVEGDQCRALNPTARHV